MIYAIRDYKTKNLLAIKKDLPKPAVIYAMAEDRKRHVSVSSGDIEMFNTKWLLKNLEA